MKIWFLGEESRVLNWLTSKTGSSNPPTENCCHWWVFLMRRKGEDSWDWCWPSNPGEEFGSQWENISECTWKLQCKGMNFSCVQELWEGREVLSLWVTKAQWKKLSSHGWSSPSLSTNTGGKHHFLENNKKLVRFIFLQLSVHVCVCWRSKECYWNLESQFIISELWAYGKTSFLVSKGLVLSMFAADHVSGWNPCRVGEARREDWGLGLCPRLWQWDWEQRVKWHSKRWRYVQQGTCPGFQEIV